MGEGQRSGSGRRREEVMEEGCRGGGGSVGVCVGVGVCVAAEDDGMFLQVEQWRSDAMAHTHFAVLLSSYLL